MFKSSELKFNGSEHKFNGFEHNFYRNKKTLSISFQNIIS